MNVNTGDIAWRVPLGITEKSSRREAKRPAVPARAARSPPLPGLVFIGDFSDDNHFRAFNAKTGKELWSAKLNASVESVPSTYLGRDGGSMWWYRNRRGDAGAPITSDEITAFRLPALVK